MVDLNFGIELEMLPSQEDYDYDDGDDSAACRAIDMMYDEGLVGVAEQHEYHCRCDGCAYDRSGSLFAAQEDGTVGVEFVSRILSTGSNSDMAELLRLRDFYPSLLRGIGWRPDGYFGAGNHIHVSHPLIDGSGPVDRAMASAYMNAMMASDLDAWRHIADGGCGNLRGYNGQGTRPDAFPSYAWEVSSSWVRLRAHTIEVRVWNTPAEADRLLVHPAISVGLIHWAFREAEVNPASSASDVLALVGASEPTHRKRLIRAIRETWPHRASADLAADLITSS